MLATVYTREYAYVEPKQAAHTDLLPDCVFTYLDGRVASGSSTTNRLPCNSGVLSSSHPQCTKHSEA